MKPCRGQRWVWTYLPCEVCSVLILEIIEERDRGYLAVTKQVIQGIAGDCVGNQFVRKFVNNSYNKYEYLPGQDAP